MLVCCIVREKYRDLYTNVQYDVSDMQRILDEVDNNVLSNDSSCILVFVLLMLVFMMLNWLFRILPCIKMTVLLSYH